jgi:16S rRNA (uracil1498-N3)-methyltransferase
VLDRFYCPESPVGGLATLTDDEAHHLTRVRRLGVGDRVELFDGRGAGWQADVVGFGKDRVELAIGVPVPDVHGSCNLTLATAVPKGERFDWLVEKATEVGVARLVPLLTQRSVVDPSTTKLERLRRVVIEACKQCGRNRVMEVGAPCRVEDYWQAHAADLKLLAHPGGLVAPAWPRPGVEGTVGLAIGPEGGFAEQEVVGAQDVGWIAVGLGPTRLRIETAGLVASALVLALAAGDARR